MSDTSQAEYLIDPDLKAAVQTAVDLEIPFLVTGEPGTGKTQLAYWVAEKLLGTTCLRFNTKTTSKARDLIYQYKALLHFRDANTGKADLNVMRYVSFAPLGTAIIQAAMKRYVVLIDEIDKAPRDFPNDVLFEFEEMKFRVEEATLDELREWRDEEKLGLDFDEEGFITHPGGEEERPPKPVLILTSNSEKNLPDAFLRRCAYYHIEFPDAKRLREIVLSKKEKLKLSIGDKLLDDLIDHFLKIRDLKIGKKPATAELLAWVAKLEKEGIHVSEKLDLTDSEIKKKLADSYILLAKTREDRDTLLKRLKLR